MAQMVKNLPARQETWIQSLGWEDSLEKGMATHFSTLAWRIPWTEEPGGLQSMGSHRVGYDWATDIEYTCIKTDISSSLEGNTYISHCWFFFMFFFFFFQDLLQRGEKTLPEQKTRTVLPSPSWLTDFEHDMQILGIRPTVCGDSVLLCSPHIADSKWTGRTQPETL